MVEGKMKGRMNPSGEQQLWNLEKVHGNKKISLAIELKPLHGEKKESR